MDNTQTHHINVEFKEMTRTYININDALNVEKSHHAYFLLFFLYITKKRYVKQKNRS